MNKQSGFIGLIVIGAILGVFGFVIIGHIVAEQQSMRTIKAAINSVKLPGGITKVAQHCSGGDVISQASSNCSFTYQTPLSAPVAISSLAQALRIRGYEVTVSNTDAIIGGGMPKLSGNINFNGSKSSPLTLNVGIARS